MFNSSKKIIAIDMGSFSLKCVEGSVQKDKIKVDNMFEIALPFGVYDNGEIKEWDRLVQLVKQQLKQHKVKANDAILTLESSEILKREISIPKVDQADMASLINFEVSQYLPIDTNQYVMQYLPLYDEIVEDVEKTNVMIAAMPNSMAKKHFDFVKDLDLNPFKLDLNGNAMLRLIKHCIDETKLSGQTIAFVDIGHSKIEINVVKRQVNKLNRIMRMGVKDIDTLLTDIYNCTVEQSQARRLAFSFESMLELRKIADANATLRADTQYYDKSAELYINKSDLDDQQLTKMQAIGDAVEYLDVCLEEIDKVFKYYNSRNVGNTIDYVYIYGGVANAVDIDSYIEQKLGVKVSVLNICDATSINLKKSNEKFSIYVNAIGAIV